MALPVFVRLVFILYSITITLLVQLFIQIRECDQNLEVRNNEQNETVIFEKGRRFRGPGVNPRSPQWAWLAGTRRISDFSWNFTHMESRFFVRTDQLHGLRRLTLGIPIWGRPTTWLPHQDVMSILPFQYPITNGRFTDKVNLELKHWTPINTEIRVHRKLISV